MKKQSIMGWTSRNIKLITKCTLGGSGYRTEIIPDLVIYKSKAEVVEQNVFPYDLIRVRITIETV